MKKKRDLVVTQEAIEDFSKLNIDQRLQWLDEMRTFLIEALPSNVKRSWLSRAL